MASVKCILIHLFHYIVSWLRRSSTHPLILLSSHDGIVRSTGASGVAYPIVAVTPQGVIADRNNGVNITGGMLMLCCFAAVCCHSHSST